MAPLSGLSKAWIAAEAAKPAGWSILGVARGPRQADPAIHGVTWVAWARPDQHLADLPPIVEGKGESAEQAVNVLARELAQLRKGIGR